MKTTSNKNGVESLAQKETIQKTPNQENKTKRKKTLPEKT